MIAGEVATAISDLLWTSDTIDIAKEVVKHSREAHDMKNHEVVKDEPKESKGRKRQPFIHQCFGHGQGAIEGFNDCEERLKHALALEMAERSGSTEFE